MNEDVLRVYFDPGEIAGYGHRYEGYPFAWFEGFDGNDPIKVMVREEAGFRCERCRHPYPPGIAKHYPGGEWTPCDDQCTHAGPRRSRYSGMTEWRETEIFGPPPTFHDEIEARWRILTVHHLNGVKHDCRWWNLAALCQRCHLTIQAKVRLERPYDRPHTEWFRPHAAGYYASVIAEDTGEPEPTRELVLASMDELLAIHATQGTLLA